MPDYCIRFFHYIFLVFVWPYATTVNGQKTANVILQAFIIALCVELNNKNSPLGDGICNFQVHCHIFALRDDPDILENAEAIDHISFLEIVYFLELGVVRRWLYRFLMVSLQLLDEGGIAVELDIYVAEIEILIGRLSDSSAS